MEVGFIRLPGSREVYDSDRRTWEPLAGKGVNYVTLTAFAGYGVGAAAGNSVLQTEAGWNALVKVCRADLSSDFPPGVVGLCRESQLQNTGIVESGLAGHEERLYANAVAQSLRDTRLVADLPLVARRQFRQALARALASARDDWESPEQVLQGAARDWREIIGQLGVAKVRDGYRVSLGLSPKSLLK
jgi:hypothetical protein